MNSQDKYNQLEEDGKLGGHYKTSSIDVIDFCKIYNLNFNKGNILKYVCRSGKKDNEIKDLLKAKDYIDRELKHLDYKQPNKQYY